MPKKTRTHRHKKYYEIINPINHLERKMEKLDAENDRLQYKVLLLSILSIILAITGVLLALFYNH